MAVFILSLFKYMQLKFSKLFENIQCYDRLIKRKFRETGLHKARIFKEHCLASNKNKIKTSRSSLDFFAGSLSMDRKPAKRRTRIKYIYTLQNLVDTSSFLHLGKQRVEGKFSWVSYKLINKNTKSQLYVAHRVGENLRQNSYHIPGICELLDLC